MIKTGICFLMAFLLILAVLPGCTTIPSSQTSQLPLETTTWNLISYMDTNGKMTDVIQDSDVTAVFSNGGISGNAGCNSYFGDYEITGSEITIGPVGSTLMYCESTGLMEQEFAYIADLGSAESYSITGSMLILADEAGNPVLVYSGIST